MSMRHPFFNEDAENTWAFNRQIEDQVKKYKDKIMAKEMRPHILTKLCIDQQENHLPSLKDCRHKGIERYSTG